jgi:hypothetical protein
MANYSGNLVRSYARADEQAGSFHPDPEHAITTTPDPTPGTHQVPAGTGVEYAGTGFPVDVAVGGGSVLATPVRSHEGHAGRRMVYTDDQHRESIGTRHGEDGQRGQIRAGYVDPPVQDSHTVYQDTYRDDLTWPANPNTTGAPAALRTAWSAIPQNNPAGVRPGVDRAWLMRTHRRLGRRRYGYQIQPLIDRAVYQDGNVPAPAGADPMAAGSVLPSWVPERVGSTFRMPGMHRTPPTVDESMLASEPAGSDVIGGGF